MDKLRVGIIGAGYIGGLHLPNVLACPRMKLIGVADLWLEAAEKIKTDGGAEFATTDPELIVDNPGIDAVLIFTSHHSHFELLGKVCRARKPFFVEKPLALTIDHVRQIQRWVKDSNVKNQVGYWFRHSPLIRRAAQAIPRPYAVLARCCRGGGPEFDPRRLIEQADPTAKSGYLDQAGYLFDVVCRLIPSEPVLVQGLCVSDRLTNTVSAQVKFADGAIATCLNSDLGVGGHLKKWFFEILGGALSASIHHNADLIFNPATEPGITGNAYFNGFNEQMGLFADYCLDGGPSPLDVWEASVPTVLMEKTLESARTGRSVAVGLHECLIPK